VAFVSAGEAVRDWMGHIKRRRDAMEKGNGEAVLESPAGGSVGETIPEENSVSVVGRFLRDGKVDTVGGERKRAQFMLAVPTSFKRRREEGVGSVAFVPVVGWGSLAERCAGLGKGSIVRVQGRLRTWKGRDERYRWEIQAELLEVLEQTEPGDQPTGNA